MVKHALPSAEWQELITFADKRSWMMPYAVKSEYQAMNKLRLLPGGRWFNPVDETQQRKVVVLGYQLAVQLFNQQEGDWFSGGELEQDPVGQIAKIGAHEFTVIGVLAKTAATLSRVHLLITVVLRHSVLGSVFTPTKRSAELTLNRGWAVTVKRWQPRYSKC